MTDVEPVETVDRDFLRAPWHPAQKVGAGALVLLLIIFFAWFSWEDHRDAQILQAQDDAQHSARLRLLQQKASANAAGADSLSDYDAELYREGILYLESRFKDPKIGAYTVAQIISAEKIRDDFAIQQQAAAHERQVQEEQRQGATQEESDVRAAISALKQSDEGSLLIRGYEISDNTLTVRVDADVWGPMSDQDKTMFKRTIWEVFARPYREANGGDNGKSPILDIIDLNGDEIDSYY